MIKEKEAMDFRESKKVHKRSWGGEKGGNYIILLISKIKNYHNCFKYQTARQYNLTAEPGRMVYPTTSPSVLHPAQKAPTQEMSVGYVPPSWGNSKFLFYISPENELLSLS